MVFQADNYGEGGSFVATKFISLVTPRRETAFTELESAQVKDAASARAEPKFADVYQEAIRRSNVPQKPLQFQSFFRPNPYSKES